MRATMALLLLFVVPVSARAAVAVSFLESSADGKSCTWVKLDAGGARKQILVFPAPCDDAQLAWNPALTEGLAFVPGPARGWRVDLASGKVTAIAFTGITAEASEVGFDAGGKLVALVGREESKLQIAKKGGKRVFVVDGVRVVDEGGADGIHGVALAYRLDGTWKRVEAKFTTFGWDYAADVHAVEIAGKLGPTSRSLDFTRSGEVPRDDAHLADLQKLRPAGDDGSWSMLKTDAGPVYFFEESAEIAYLTAPVRWLATTPVRSLDGDKLVEPPGLGLDGPIVITAKGDYLLIKKMTAVRLYDVRKKMKVFSTDNGHDATFWP